jgi:N-acetyltransferase 10
MKKKVDSRIQTCITNGFHTNQRSIFVIVGDRARYQVVNFHYILAKQNLRTKPAVLWCYKKELGFSSHQKKRMKEVKNMQTKGLYDSDVDDPFQLFIASTDIKYSFYKDSHKVLGST